MIAEVVPAEVGDQAVIENLFQYYVYDFSQFGLADVEPTGRFAVTPLDAYWAEPSRHPFLIRADGALAGFALVHRGSRISGDAAIWDMAEFFVLRGLRRRGVGVSAAIRIFERFPGAWEVRQTESNAAATAFWQRVIGGFTGGGFQETRFDDGRWKGPVQSFRSPG